VARDLSERYLTSDQLLGLVELEYKLDPRDGQYKLLGRQWTHMGYHTLELTQEWTFPRCYSPTSLGTPAASSRQTRG